MTTVLFACVHNAGRSQMAAAWFNRLADPTRARAISAGTAPAAQVHPEVVAAMDEVGIDLGAARPTALTAALAGSVDVLVTMGCGETCPVVPGLRRIDWSIPDPKGQPIERVREIRDRIRDHVRALLGSPLPIGHTGAMDVRIRPATEADVPFLAWVQQEAARSHLPRGFYDLAFPGSDDDRLRVIGRICRAGAKSFCHWSGFLVAEAGGRPAAALTGYTSPSVAAGSALMAAMAEALDAEGWSAAQRHEMGERIAPFLTCIPDAAEDAWVIEWVATRPEARGRGLVRDLLAAILERGRERGHAQAQIAVLIGNTPAQRAYEGAGFRVVDEKTHPDFERALGSPGVRRLLR